MLRRPLFLLALLTLLAGCSDDNTNNQGDQDAQDVQDTQDGEEDIQQIGEVSDPDMSGSANPALVEAWPLLTVVSDGEVTVTEAAGVFTATIDATAGGFGGRQDNPFVYLDLDGGAKVEITDVASASSNTEWELAFKRTTIRSNSVDSGPGSLEIAQVRGATFAEVTAAPTDTIYQTDHSLDDEGNVQFDPIGYPLTAFNFLNLDNATGSSSWYDYSEPIGPTPGHIYVIKGSDGGDTFKLEISGWDSGLFTIQWQAL